jgi:hypothetical protein
MELMPGEPVSISFTLEFKRNLRALAKKYRYIRSDIQPLIDNHKTPNQSNQTSVRQNFAPYFMRWGTNPFPDMNDLS